MAQFTLTRTFRTEQVEDGERAGCESDDVTEECGEIEAKAYLAIVAKDEKELTGEVLETDHGEIEMHKLTLEAEIVGVLLINLGESWQVVVALFAQMYDAVFINFAELPSIIDAVAKGIKAFLVLAKLLDLGCRLGLFIEETLQFDEFLLTGLPDEVAERFKLLTELLE